MVNGQPEFPVTLSLRIDWSEMDIFRHVNNVTYFKYVQASRVNYWEQAGLAQLHQTDHIVPMLLSTQCRFIKPLFYPGNVVIKASVVYMKNSSFGIQHRLFNDAGDVVAEAEDVVVLLNERSGEKVFIPEEIRKVITRIEGL